MGKENYPDKYRLQNSALRSVVWDYLDGPNSFNQHYRWTYGFPRNLRILNSNFQIKEENISGIFAHCILQGNNLPANVFFDVYFSISDTTYLHKLISLKDTIRSKFLKRDNFAFRYYSNVKGAKFSFITNSAVPADQYIPFARLEESIPQLKTVDKKELVNFFIDSPGGKSQWGLLPDNKLILLNHTGEANVAGLPSEETYRVLLLDSKGIILNN
jgi:hypothetical protein